jgi:hypothetical protein
MKKVCFTVVSAVALLSLANLANAQGAGTGIGSGTATGAASNQCWDVSTNMVRDKGAGGSATRSSATGSTTGTVGSGSAGISGGTKGGGSIPDSIKAAARPDGMPNC